MIKSGLSAKLIGFLLIVFVFTTYGLLHYYGRGIIGCYLESHRNVYSETISIVNTSLNEVLPHFYDGFLDSNLDPIARILNARLIITDDKGMIYYDSEKVRTGLRMSSESWFGLGQQKSSPIFLLIRMEHIKTEYLPLKKDEIPLTRFENTSLRMIAPLSKKKQIYGYLIITEPLTDLNEELVTMRNHVILFMSVWFILVVVAYGFLIRRLLLIPIHRLTEVTQKVAKKDFSDRVNYTSSDEMGRLSRSFNTMIYNLEKIQREAEERNEGLIHLSAELEARNQELQRKQKLLESDLQLAHNIQQELLPQVYPKIEGIKIAAANFQVGDIGGDCFDFYKLAPKKFGAFIGDVSGKGISAALVMSMVTVLFGQLKDRYSTPDEMLTKVNEIMYRHFGSQHSIYLTCFFLIVDVEKMRIDFSCAGHTPPFLYRKSDDRIISLEAEGFGLGMFAGVNYERKSIPVQPGDKIILYTDGVVETRNAEGMMFGLDRLTQRVQAYPAANSFQLTHFLVEDIGEFAGATPRQDDLTILVVGIEEDSK